MKNKISAFIVFGGLALYIVFGFHHVITTYDLDNISQIVFRI